MKIEDAAQWLTEDIKECESDRGKYKGSPFKEGIERRKELYIIALSAITKQIPKVPERHELERFGKDMSWYTCGNCKSEISKRDKYCHWCGHAVAEVK